MKMFLLRTAVLAVAALLPWRGAAADLPRYQDKTAPVEARVDDLLPRLTLDEKISLLGGDRSFYIRAIPRLALPAIKMADGPLGVRNYGRSTAYPATVALAATWDVVLAQEFGTALGRDSRARGVHILLAPAVNIQRVPQNGRNFEYLTEDPALAAALVVPLIRGIQSQGVVATVKHYAVNNQETERMTIDARVSQRALHEIYLPAFRAAVQEGKVWAVMSAYNRLNGFYATANDWLNNQVLRKEWGFSGLVMSDWGAVHETLGVANAGMDLEMPSGRFLNATALTPLIESGKVTVATLDEKVRRILRLEIANGFLDRPQDDPSILPDDPRSAAVALQIAREGIVLLKNEKDLLPLDRSKLKHVVVLGPNAGFAPAGGGSSRVQPFHSVTILDGVRASAGTSAKIESIAGIGPELLQRLLPTAAYTGPLQLEFLTGRRNPTVLAKTTATAIDQDWTGRAPAEGVPIDNYLARWSGTIAVPATGDYAFLMQALGRVRVTLDDKDIINDRGTSTNQALNATLPLEGGTAHKLIVEYVHGRAGDSYAQETTVRFAWGLAPPLLSDAEIAQVRAADAVVLNVGFDSGREAEGSDRPFELPAAQTKLIHTVTALNPRTIVVLNSGGTVATSDWIGSVPAFLQAWYPGQEGGRALGEILFGDVNPSGKLPHSFEKRWEDNAAHDHFPGVGGKVDYAEDILVGYRWLDRREIAPLFPFGFGLSYTRFAYEHLKVIATEGGYGVQFDVTNTGTREGAEIGQVYVAAPDSKIPRAVRELKGFSRATLQPGETKTFSVPIARSALAYFDETKADWVVSPGRYTIGVGASSRDLRLSAPIDVP